MPLTTCVISNECYLSSEIGLLEIPIMALMPRSGWKAWRYHIAEKSPNVQPTRHRRVLTPARLQICLDDQNSSVLIGGVSAALVLLLHDVVDDLHCGRRVDVVKDVSELGHALRRITLGNPRQALEYDLTPRGNIEKCSW